MTNDEIKNCLEGSTFGGKGDSETVFKNEMKTSKPITFGDVSHLYCTFLAEVFLENSIFNSTVIFHDCDFRKGISFKKATFHNHVTFSNCHGEVMFDSNTTFLGGLTIKGDTKNINVKFDNCTFTQSKSQNKSGASKPQVTFKNLDLKGKLINCTFEEGISAYFENVEFDKLQKKLTFGCDVTFKKIKLPEEDFDSFIFLRKANFENVQFNGCVKSEVFKDEVSFKQVILNYEYESPVFDSDFVFPKKVYIEGIEHVHHFNSKMFGGEVCLKNFPIEKSSLFKNFNNPIFSGKVTLIFDGDQVIEKGFEGCTFENGLSIEGGIIKCDFGGFNFLESTSFKNVSFDKETIFEGVTFGAKDNANSKVNFNNCTFTTDISFNETTFHAKANFNECKFKGNINFGKDDFDPNQDKRTSFKKLANFYNCTFGIEKTDRKFKPTEVSFKGVKFQEGASFKETTFHSKVRFHHAIFKQSANFENTKFNDLADFYKATFEAAQQFHLTDFMGITIFSNATFEKEVQFLYNKVSSTTYISFQEVKFKQALDISRANFSCTLSFFGVEIEENPTELFLYKYGVTSGEIEQCIIKAEQELGVGVKNSILSPQKQKMKVDKAIEKYIKDLENEIKKRKNENQAKKDQEVAEKQKALENIRNNLKRMLNGIMEGKKHPEKAYQKIRESFRLVKHTFASEGNKIEAGKQNRQEMQAYREELKASKRLPNVQLKWYEWIISPRQQNLAILWVNGLSNRHGTSWVRGFVFTMLAAAFFCAGLSWHLQDQWHWSWTTEGTGYAAQVYLQFLNLTKMTYKPYNAEITSWGYVILFVGRLFVGYGIYQTVQAFRKFSRK